MEKEKFQYSREAAKITFDKISSWEELNAATLKEADEKFKEKTKETWKDFAVHGILQFDSKEGKQVLKPFTDLDGKSALGVLREAGINTDKLAYVRPGEYLKGAINIDTGDQFGVVYEEPTYTAYFDHHALGTKEVSSATEIVYKTMIDLGMVEKSNEMDRLVDFVTKIDNRKFPGEEFLRSPKTLLGLQRSVDFEKALAYFRDHESPTKELTPEEFAKYGLKEAAEQQQKIVNEEMKTLERMEKEGKIKSTAYGNIVINENNELKTAASAAYVKFDGIVNYTPEKSFAVTLKNGSFDEEVLRKELGDKFQGKIIRGQMWIYNDKEPLRASLEDIMNTLEKSKKESELVQKMRIKSQLDGIHFYRENGGDVLLKNIPNNLETLCLTNNEINFLKEYIPILEKYKEGSVGRVKIRLVGTKRTMVGHTTMDKKKQHSEDEGGLVIVEDYSLTEYSANNKKAYLFHFFGKDDNRFFSPIFHSRAELMVYLFDYLPETTEEITEVGINKGKRWSSEEK